MRNTVSSVFESELQGRLALCRVTRVNVVARPPGSSIGRTVPWRPAKKPAYLTRPLRLGFALRKGTCFPGIQKLLRVETAEKFDQLCDHAGPTCLVAGPESRAVIAVEVLVEQDVILPVGIGLE